MRTTLTLCLLASLLAGALWAAGGLNAALGIRFLEVVLRGIPIDSASTRLYATLAD